MALCRNSEKADVARRTEPLGAVLAGGSGLRMGGSKATVALHGRPLISYPLEAMWRGLGQAVVIAKPDTELPSLPGVTVWLEPDTPRHPLVGIMHALEMAEGRPVVVCAADLPFVTPSLVRHLARGARGACAVIASSGDLSQPLLGWYHPRALEALRAFDPGEGPPMREVVARLDPEHFEVGAPEHLFNVNTPDDLLQATAMLDAWARSSS
jgi:molybdopterin-guanine dinucleotide biosynthesis protein A